jgi:hypothetical protein
MADQALFAGTTPARLIVQYGAMEPLQNTARRAFAFDDVTLALYKDRLCVYDRRNDTSVHGPGVVVGGATSSAAKLVLACSFVDAVASVSSANTRRGIAIELVPPARNGMHHPAASELLPASATAVTVQLAFASPDDREQAYTMIFGQWQRARKAFQSAVPISSSDGEGHGPSRLAGSVAVSRTLPSDPMATPTRKRTGPPSQFDHVYAQLQSLKGQTNSLLADVRSAYEADGDGNDREDAVLREFATRRDAVTEMAQELEAIQHRRAQRQHLISKISPSTAAALRGSSPQAQRDALLASVMAVAPNECKHCRVAVNDPQRLAAHVPKCAHRPVKCNACGMRMRAKDVLHHRQNECAAGSASADDDIRSLAESVRSGGSSHSSSSFASVSPPSSPVVNRSRSTTLPARRSAAAASPVSSPRSPSSSEDDRGLSRREREKLRVRRVLEEQEAERRHKGATTTPTPRSHPSASAPTTSESPKAGGLTKVCVHCGKVAPVAHESRCAHKIVTCKRCRERVTARDAKRHAEVCAARRSAPPAATPASPNASVSSTRFKPRASSP